MIEIVCIGNRTRDILCRGNSQAEATGGSVTYALLCLKKLKARVAALSASSKAEFKIDYDGNEQRTLQILNEGGKIESIPEKYLKTKAVIFAPVFREITPELLDRFQCLRAINIQGIIRSRKGRRIVHHIPEHFFDFLNVEIVSMNEEEAQFVARRLGVDTEQLCRLICKRKPEMVIIILGSAGSFLFQKGSKKLLHIPAFKTKTVDPTGAGDVYIASFVLSFIHSGEAIRSAYFASAASSFVVEDVGPARFGSQKEVLLRMKELEDRQAG